MSILSRFFGRTDESSDTTGLIANPAIDTPLSLQMVFGAPLRLQADALAAALRAYHPHMRDAKVEMDPDMPTVLGLLGWGKHVIKFIGFDARCPDDTLETCVAPAHYPAHIKAQVREHSSHLILYYAGYDEDPREQYVALAAVTGALADMDTQALAIFNEHAHTSLPASVFSSQSLRESDEDSLDLLRELPLTALYCGFVKYGVEDVSGVWMRTYGGDLFGLPDFAVLAEGHHQGEHYSDMFHNVMDYLYDSGAEMSAGHTMQIGEDSYMRLRDPEQDEYFLHGPGTVLVAEIIDASQINLWEADGGHA